MGVQWKTWLEGRDESWVARSGGEKKWLGEVDEEEERKELGASKSFRYARSRIGSFEESSRRIEELDIFWLWICRGTGS